MILDLYNGLVMYGQIKDEETRTRKRKMIVRLRKTCCRVQSYTYITRKICNLVEMHSSTASCL
jgi:hypothetical protein